MSGQTLLQLVRRVDASLAGNATVTLAYDQRCRGRLRVVLDDGREAGLLLERGRPLRNGETIATDDGETVVAVRAADEPVTTVYCPRALDLARVAYHLGNRHVALQVGDGWVRYQPDHVLDDMVRGLGFDPVAEHAAFDPESGAYAHAHAHPHD